MDSNERSELVAAVLAALKIPADKPMEAMGTEELRDAVAEYQRGTQPARPQPPDAPGCAGLSDKARETANTLYGENILNKQAGQITPDEREFLRAGIAATLKDLGY